MLTLERSSKVIEVMETTFDMQAASNLIEKDKVHAILGPQYPEQARYIVKLGESLQKPVIWFPITGPSLLPPLSPYSHEGLNCFQFQAIADVIKALGWHSVIPIYEDTEYGTHLISCLPSVLKDMGIRMANVIAIDSDSTPTEINGTIDKLKEMQPHLFVVHMSMDFGTRFILSAEAKDMMDKGYAWILTQALSSLTDPQVRIGDPLKGYMQGALGVRPIDLIAKKTEMRRKKEKDFRLRFGSSLAIYGWWAYHTIEALAMAVEMAVEKNDTINGTILGSEILATNFKGNSGVNFDLRNGQLDQPVKYEVYNVIGKRERIIGSWIPVTKLQNHGGDGGNTSGEYPLEDPLWPGDTMKKPPRLRIGVTKTNSFPEFVNADSTPPTGFAINVFLKALDVLPFPLNYYEFVPLSNKGSGTTMYDGILCNQMMKDERLDAIIGDITIVAHRTQCVDFTVPYLDSSVAMMVRVKNATTSKGILLKPFKWSLWLILGGIFVAATIIIIILERFKTNETNKINEIDKSNETNETDKFLFNPFLVYKIDVMKINLANKAAGWMVILTSFLFILVLQVYTANLTSILTQQGKMREPSFKDENDIMNKNLWVGYQNGSWVRRFLIEQKGFKSSQLKALGSREEYIEALTSGTKNGGVDAIFDETPYLTLFLSKYKSHFMLTGPINKTGGFAFAFPKKSGLASHFSKAILEVTQDLESYRVVMAKCSLPTSIEDWEFEDQNDEETEGLSITNFGGFYPVLLSVVALFLGLVILNPSMIQQLCDKKPCLSQLNKA